ncbi:MAG: hypothetical protein K0U68_02655 [Gammaproteobacteria bacterium]|nr:hypothetical protein [Gammaproteobacteria bacterium]
MGKHSQACVPGLLQLFAGFVLLFAVESAFAIDPENGWWWNEQEPGRGFNLEIQNKTVFVAAFVYTEDGQAVWYSGSGELQADNSVTIELSEFSNGQCIRCTFKAAELKGNADTVTIRFLTGNTAEIDWSGGTVAIKRFNFNLGSRWQDQMLGEWMLVSGSTLIAAYTGDRIIFDELEQTSDALVVKGHRQGNNNAQISVFDAIENNTSVKGFGYSGLMLTDSATLRAYAFDFQGLNRIDGITVDIPEQSTEQEINEALVNRGVAFTAFRIN